MNAGLALLRLGTTVIAAFAIAGLLIASASFAAGAAASDEGNDLREFRIGMRVADLPRAGYRDFVCVADHARKLADWTGYRLCPADAKGWREIGFRYDPGANPQARFNASDDATKVAGHPVRLALLIGDAGDVTGLRIATDPEAPLYLRKKAFLLADQVMARYGREGWHCVEAAPGGDAEPLGGVFIREHCEKTTPTRHLILDRALYRHPGDDSRHFVNSTEILIESAATKP